MKNTFGNNMTVTLFGESHGPYIGIVMDGLTPGLDIDIDFIDHQLALRRPSDNLSTARREADEYQIVSGAFNNKTTGTPLTIIIPNTSQKSADYDKTGRIARPGHADYTAQIKYHGFEDYRGGGHFSGRITAPIVAAGAIALSALNKKGIKIATHIKSVGEISERSFENVSEDIDLINSKNFPTLEEASEAKYRERITQVASEGDSIGGILETAVYGMPAGVGEPWFDSVESVLAHAMYSIPAVKGVQFGIGFDGTKLQGSQYNDGFVSTEDGIKTVTNNNGGINGGITNGMPILFSLAVKPTPSIYKEQDSINLKTGENTKLNIVGRHDPAIIHRARVVVDSMTALVMYDLLCGRYGTDYFAD